MSLRVCDDLADGPCTSEIARWITAYKRSGRWVTEISPNLALLPRSGPVRLRLEPGGVSAEAPYVVDMVLHTSVACDPAEVPFDHLPLWEGGPFDQDYNSLHDPIEFTPPAGTRRVEIVAHLTGHGWGSEIDNCAEFCNHTHHFRVGAVAGEPRDLVVDHPEANSAFGCADRVSEGVVPNQYGTWAFGRGGWCPGLDVPPRVFDITAAIDLTGPNVIEYTALFRGADYSPRPNPADPGGFGAVIDLDSRLVFRR